MTGHVRRFAGVAVILGIAVLAVLGLLRAAGSEDRRSLPEQVQTVAADLRCPTCQGLSIADSASVLAAGSRQVIEDQLRAGQTPDQIRQYFVDRYGEQVLLSPDPSGARVLVWLLPVLAVAAGGAITWRWLRRTSGTPAATAEAAAAARTTDAEASRALEDHRAGRLRPDGSPAGEALREALDVRLAAEQDDPTDAEALARADRRLAAASRRYLARDTSIRNTSGRSRTPGPALPRRAVTIGSAIVLVAVAGVGVGSAMRDRGTGDPLTGDSGAQASAQTASDTSRLRAEVEARPQDPAAWLALGQAHDRERQVDQAVGAYDRVLELEPAADHVALLRSNVLVRAGRGAEALPRMQELAARYPDDPDVLLVFGLAQEATGAPEAVETLRRFLELAPHSPAAPGVRSLLEDR